MMWPTVSVRTEPGSKTVRRERTGFSLLRSPFCRKSLAVSLLLLVPVFCQAGTAYRAIQSVFDSDHGRRRIAFPAGSLFTAPRVSGSSVILGSSGGYGVFRFDLRDVRDPKFMRGIPYSGESAGPAAFLAYYGYFPVEHGLLVVGVLTDSLEFFEFIPMPGTPRIVRVSEPQRELLVLADDGLRTYDISSPSRPVISGFQPSLRSGPPGTAGAVTAFCAMPKGGIARVEAPDLRTVLLPDGGKQTFPENVKELFEKEGKLLVLTESSRLLDENGNEILHQAEMFSLENGVSTWLSTEGENAFFHRESAGQKSVWQLPDILKECRAFHADGDLFAALYDRTLYFGTLKSSSRTADIQSSVPVIGLEGPLALRNSMAYGVSGSDGRNFLLYGMDFHLPPRDGTPYDFLFPYSVSPEDPEEEYVPFHDSALAVGRYLFAPGALIRLVWPGPKMVCPLGPPASSVRLDDSGRRVILTYAKRKNGKMPGAVVYDISELPELRKIAETEEPSGFIDAIADGENLWLLSPDGRIVCSSLSSGKKLSELPAPANARTNRFLRVGSFLHVLPAPGDPSKLWRIIDIREPARPFVRKEIEGLLPDGAADAALSGESLFTAGGPRIGRFDVSDPENPVWKENFRGKDFSRANYTGLEVRGKLLIGRKQGNLDVWDNWTKGDDHHDDSL